MDLLKISISYVRELRRSTILNNVYPTGDQKQGFSKIGRSLSINPLSMSQLPRIKKRTSLSFSNNQGKESNIKSEYQHVRSKSTNEETNSDTSLGKNRRLNWLKAMSTIKSLSSIADAQLLEKTVINSDKISSEIKGDIAFDLKKSKDINNESFPEFGRSPLNSFGQHYLTQHTNEWVIS